MLERDAKYSLKYACVQEKDAKYDLKSAYMLEPGGDGACKFGNFFERSDI
jgi:hypothetical protein